MHPRLYRLMERHQRIDGLLQIEQRRARRDPFRILRLKKLKLHVKELIHQFTARQRKARHAMP